MSKFEDLYMKIIKECNSISNTSKKIIKESNENYKTRLDQFIRETGEMSAEQAVELISTLPTYDDPRVTEPNDKIFCIYYDQTGDSEPMTELDSGNDNVNNKVINYILENDHESVVEKYKGFIKADIDSVIDRLSQLDPQETVSFDISIDDFDLCTFIDLRDKTIALYSNDDSDLRDWPECVDNWNMFIDRI